MAEEKIIPLELLVIALDGASPRLIRKYGDRLPTLSRLCRQGSYGQILSLTSSLDIWMTYYTGLVPEKHGLQLMKVRETKNNNPFEKHSLGNVRCKKFLWDYINETGMPMGMVGALGTFPAPALQGFVFSGELLFGPHDQAFYPPELKSLYGERTFSYPDPPTLGRSFLELTREEIEAALTHDYFKEGILSLNVRLECYRRLLEEVTRLIPVKVLFLYFIDLDIIQHFSFHEPALETILEGYQIVDNFIEELINKFLPVRTLVISDHGVESFTNIMKNKVASEPLPPSYKTLSNGVIVAEASNKGIISGAHIQEGFYVLNGPGVKKDCYKKISFINVFPMILRAMSIPIPTNIDGKTPDLFVSE